MKPKAVRKEIKENEDKFRGLIEKIQDGVLALDRNWRIVYINRVAEARLHREHGSLVGKIIWEEFPDAKEGPFFRFYQEAFHQQKSQFVEDYSATVGTWIRASIYPSPDGISIFFNDITEKKVAEQRARESENKYRQLLDRITDGFIALDMSFCYIYANQKIGEMVRQEPESLIGRNVWEVFPDAVGSYTYKAFQTAMKEQRFISNIDYYPPLNLWQENYIYPSSEGLSVFIKDISEKKRLEKELEEQSRRQQMQIITTALEAQEKERSYIGRELHDNVNQIITATKLILALVRDSTAKDNKLISICIGNLEKAIQENRKIAHELVTPHFTDVNLVESIDELLRSMLSTKGMKTQVISTSFHEDLLDDKRKLALYRIVQEQCTNISKHAQASSVSVTLTTNESACAMIISDNGIGTNADKSEKGIGLKNIEGRLQIYNGTLQVVSEQGKGFALHIYLPLDDSL